MRFTFSAIIALAGLGAALPATNNIATRQELMDQCTNFGETWCVGGQTWTCSQITFDKGLVRNTFKDCGAKVKRQDLNTKCTNMGEEWCVGGQKWTCRQITFDQGLVTNTYKDC